MECNVNKNNKNLKCEENKDIQNEEEEIDSILNYYLISKDLFDFLESEKKNNELKVLNKKRKLKDK